VLAGDLGHVDELRGVRLDPFLAGLKVRLGVGGCGSSELLDKKVAN
jgi:hypothetical protein